MIKYCIFCSKYEEIYPPEVGEFAYITDNTYSKKQVSQSNISLHE